jgi:RNA polymerase sigma factor (sigma-70 family)
MTVSGHGPIRQPAPSDETDPVVLDRVAAGDLRALEVLYDRYGKMAYSLALRITAEASAAEDVVQDAFLGAWRNASLYAAERGSVKTWLLSIVHHRAIDAIRRREPASELPDRDDASIGGIVADVWPEVAANLDRTAVRAALADLSDVQRLAIELAYFGGLTQAEIAARTGAPLGTVKSRMRLGLLALRRALTGVIERDDQAAATFGPAWEDR